jgi:hypothetical protein
MLTSNGGLEGFGSAHTTQIRDDTCETRHPPKPAATNRAPDITMSAHQSASHPNQHDQTTCPECLSKARCPFALIQYPMEPKCKTSSAPMHGQALSSSQMEHALSAVARNLEAYEPLKRWNDEKLREQSWHGISRELMSDEWSRDNISDCGRPADGLQRLSFEPFVPHDRETEE